MMPIPLDAPEVLNREFLEIRARILQVAAAWTAWIGPPDRWLAIRGAAKSARPCKPCSPSRAIGQSRVQQLFSLPFDPKWKEQFALNRTTYPDFHQHTVRGLRALAQKTDSPLCNISIPIFTWSRHDRRL